MDEVVFERFGKYLGYIFAITVVLNWPLGLFRGGKVM